MTSPACKSRWRHPARGAAQTLLVAVILLSTQAVAHDVGVARVDVHELGAGHYRVQVKLPQTMSTDAPRFPARCQVGAPDSRPLPGRNRSDSWEVQCVGAAMPGEQLVFPWRREGIAVNTHAINGATQTVYLPGGESGAVLPMAQILAPDNEAGSGVSHYLLLGVEHILLGWDHLAFVLALCLMARGMQLLTLVTLFTVGHSVTLLLASLEWVHLPTLPVEICIALSVAFIAREALRPGNTPTRHGAFMVLCFGLLHGLGFASALGDTGIQGTARALGLLMFNLGVEAGQLLFIAAVFAVALLMRNRVDTRALQAAVGFAVGTLGVYWSIDRVALLVT